MLGPFIPGSRGTFMLDGVSVALAVVLPVLAFSIFQIKVRLDPEVAWCAVACDGDFV